ncbi:MAG: endonuclease III [Chlamydiia bacterium]|nr:endonuclease III [Chlamydiia bacterium]
MKKRDKVDLIINILETLFPNPSIPLYHKDSYTLLIAVLLSARTTDKQVNKVTPILFQIADTPSKMARQSPAAIQKVIKTCGLAPQKAKQIVALSKRLLKDFEGEVPQTFSALESLPGVGHKTASVVMAQAFSLPAFPVDTHIYRCAKRWKLSSGKNVAEIEKDLKKIFPKEKWISLHLQMIYFARKFCPALGHRKDECPICSLL